MLTDFSTSAVLAVAASRVSTAADRTTPRRRGPRRRRDAAMEHAGHGSAAAAAAVEDLRPEKVGRVRVEETERRSEEEEEEGAEAVARAKTTWDVVNEEEAAMARAQNLERERNRETCYTVRQCPVICKFVERERERERLLISFSNLRHATGRGSVDR